MQLPNDEIMRQMAKLALEKATTYFADMADQFADNISEEISGKDALRSFATAIRSANSKVWPAGKDGA